MKNADERAIIDMEVVSDEGFTSPYSAAGKPVISAEVADFLENAANAHHPRKSLILNVYGDCIDDGEKLRYDAAIRNYYKNKLGDVERSIARKSVVSLIFTVVGILGLIAMFVLDHLGANGVWVECVDIFAWVFLWEAVDQFFIERGLLLLKRKRDLAFIKMEINFYPARRPDEFSAEDRPSV